MMQRRKVVVRAARVCAALLLYGVAVMAGAQVTALQATQQQWGNTWLTQGTISMIPVTPAGQPIAFGANGKFYPPLSGFSAGFQGTVVRGALTAPLLVPDRLAATGSGPLCYDQQVRNANTNQTVDLGVRCDISGSSVSLDSYFYPVTSYAHGAASLLPARCVLGAIYGADDTQALYRCGVDGLFHPLAGGSGGGSSASLLLTDSSGHYWTVSMAAGRVSLVASQSGSGAVPSVNFTDTVSGAYLALSVACDGTGCRLAVSPGSSSGALASFALVDSATNVAHTLTAASGRFLLN